MTSRKICLVITNRGTYARMKTVMERIKDSPELELSIISGGSTLLDRYGTAVNIIERDHFKVDAKTYMVVEGENPVTMAKSTGLAITELATLFDNMNPNIVLAVGDRFETMATAIAASYINKPLAHVQGGEISGSIDEKVRHAVTKFADIHLVSNELARRRVIRLGEDPEYVFVTGCPSIDLAMRATENSSLDFDPYEKYLGVGAQSPLNTGYIVVVQHPVTTEYENSLFQIEQTLQALNDLETPILWFWSNVDAGSDKISHGIRKFREERKPKFMHFFKNMAPEDFYKLAYNSMCIVGNSSVAIRECSFLGVPAVNIGNRQNDRDKGGNIIDVGYDKNKIKEAVMRQMHNGRYKSELLYGDGHAGEKIAKILKDVKLKIEKSIKRIDYL